MRVAMSGELHVLARRLERIADQHRYSRDFTFNTLHEALGEVIACFPVYRTYARQGKHGSVPRITAEDRHSIVTAVQQARLRNASISKTLFHFIASILLFEESDDLSQEQRLERRDFVMRFQQMTGPVAAKGVEDTAFYRYFPLASLCEVGGTPQRFGVSIDEFHTANLERQKDWPHTLLATSTHDTKRGEDVRARLNVLSEIPDLWDQTLRQWQQMNQGLKTAVNGVLAPDSIEEYLIYQTLIGTFPFRFEDDESRDAYERKIQEYVVKALREAKIHSSWLDPMEEYEGVVRNFVSGLLARDGNFLTDFTQFQNLISRAGVFNSLSQVLLKVTSPGTPDFYQGTESWDFSLVDPDNRRHIDYSKLTRQLTLLRATSESISPRPEGFLGDPADGAIKMFATSRLLEFRIQNRTLFERGEYVPLSTGGASGDRVISFARREQNQTVIAVATRFFATMMGDTGSPLDEQAWGDTRIELHDELAGCYRDVLTGQRICGSDDKSAIFLSEICRHLPVALLVRDSEAGAQIAR